MASNMDGKMIRIIMFFDKIVESFCNKSENMNDTLKCIDDKTFKLSEMVKNTQDDSVNLNDPDFWSQDISCFFYGKSVTLIRHYEIGTDWLHSLKIILDKRQVYNIWIHDQHFFLTSTNPLTIPHTLLNLNDIEQIWLYLQPIYHHMIDKPEKRCESSESYSFTACIKNSISRRIG